MVNLLKFKTLFSINVFIKAGIKTMHVKIANREAPDQTASSEENWCGSALFE